MSTLSPSPANPAPGGERSIQVDGNVTQSTLITGDNVQIFLRSLPEPVRANFKRFINYYADDVFGGREAELNALDAVLHDPNPYTLLVAPTGRGKSALLVRWVARLLQRGDWRVIFVPISIRFKTADEQSVLHTLAYSLADLHNDLPQFQQYDRSSPDALRVLIDDYLNRPLPDGVRCLLVIDGLDETVGWEVGTLLVIPANSRLKVVASARQRADRGYDEWREHLGWHVHRCRQFSLATLNRAALIDLLRAQGEPFATLAADPAFITQFARVSEGDPLTCNLLIKALRAGTLTPENLSRRPPGLSAFLRDWVEKLRHQRQQSQAIRELLALCAIAYGPLTSNDLATLAPAVFTDQSTIVDAVRSDEVARFVITVGDHSYVFSHQRLREVFLEEIYPPAERERLHRRLVEYGRAWWTNRQQPLPTYLRQFWLEHCAALGEWALIREVVSAIVPTADGWGVEQPWQAVRYAAEGSDSGYLSDLDRLWRWAEAQRDWGLALRCAVIAASLRSRSGNLPPALLVALVQVGTPAGKWSAAAALEHIAHMPDSQRQADCIEALLEAGVELPWERALEVARAIGDAAARARALAALAPHLPPALLPEALAAAREIEREDLRIATLAALAPHLPPNEQPIVYAEALAAARAIERGRARADELAALAPHLPPNEQPIVYAEALAAARAIGDEWSRSQALAALAPHLPPALLPAALAAARAIEREEWRSKALAALAPHLPPALLPETLTAAREIRDDDDRARALAALAPHLPPGEQPIVYAAALATARDIRDAADQVRALAALAPTCRWRCCPRPSPPPGRLKAKIGAARRWPPSPPAWLPCPRSMANLPLRCASWPAVAVRHCSAI
jgi:hypothetical protein